MIAKLVTPELMFVAIGTPATRRTFVYGARPPLGVSTRLAEAPKQRVAGTETNAQLGFGLTMLLAVQEVTQPLASVMFTKYTLVPTGGVVIAKFVAPKLMLVAIGTPPVLRTFVYGARPPIGVSSRLAEAPKHNVAGTETNVQLGLGLTMLLAVQEVVQPLASVIVTV